MYDYNAYNMRRTILEKNLSKKKNNIRKKNIFFLEHGRRLRRKGPEDEKEEMVSKV